MIRESELVTLLLALVLVFYLVASRQQVQRLPRYQVLLASLGSFLAGWILTVLEGFFLADLLNLLEHVGYASGALLLAVWCWRVLGVRRGQT